MTPLIQELKEKAEKAIVKYTIDLGNNDDVHRVRSIFFQFEKAANPSTILKLIKALEIAEEALENAITDFDCIHDIFVPKAPDNAFDLVCNESKNGAKYIKEALEQIKKELSE